MGETLEDPVPEADVLVAAPEASIPEDPAHEDPAPEVDVLGAAPEADVLVATPEASIPEDPAPEVDVYGAAPEADVLGAAPEADVLLTPWTMNCQLFSVPSTTVNWSGWRCKKGLSPLRGRLAASTTNTSSGKREGS